MVFKSPRIFRPCLDQSSGQRRSSNHAATHSPREYRVTTVLVVFPWRSVVVVVVVTGGAPCAACRMHATQYISAPALDRGMSEQ